MYNNFLVAVISVSFKPIWTALGQYLLYYGGQNTVHSQFFLQKLSLGQYLLGTNMYTLGTNMDPLGFWKGTTPAAAFELRDCRVLFSMKIQFL